MQGLLQGMHSYSALDAGDLLICDLKQNPQFSYTDKQNLNISDCCHYVDIRYFSPITSVRVWIGIKIMTG